MSQSTPARALRLLRQRGIELVRDDSYLSRRARTMSVRTALGETANLAWAYLRSRGVMRPGAPPDEAGHGIKMLPDVVAETLSILTADAVLKHDHSGLGDSIRAAVNRMLAEPLREADVRRLESHASVLENLYIGAALDRLHELVFRSPQRLSELDCVCGSLVSELRARGWSDEQLQGAFERISETATDLAALRNDFEKKPRKFECFVACTLTSVRAHLPSDDSFTVVDDLPGAVQGAPAKGPYLKITLSSVDPRHAARLALGRAQALVGTLEVFVASDVAVRRRVVVVNDGGALSAVDELHHSNRQRRGLRPGALSRIASSVLAALHADQDDAVFDAIRHRAKALQTPDPESRFMLLWTGVERLVMGGPTGLVESARTLVPKAIALGKLRRDLGVIAAEIDAAEIDSVGSDDDAFAELYKRVGLEGAQRRVDRIKLAESLFASEEENRGLLAPFYEHDARLTQWWWSLRDRLKQRQPEAIAGFFEESRQRHEWQVLRLYRARNAVAHGVRAPVWLGDLIRHAHFYLTELVAIAVHYREEASDRPAYDILAERAAQYDVFLQLVKAGVPTALAATTLVRPTILVGPHESSAGP